jgi:hypothetical protein
MTIESCARERRLRIRLDECGDRIIPGKRGHLYFDGGVLCLMVTERAQSGGAGGRTTVPKHKGTRHRSAVFFAGSLITNRIPKQYCLGFFA